MYFLYYAGMGADKFVEQIGLAVSKDGLNFGRVNGDGLIIPPDPQCSWRTDRTCNPTVLKIDDRFIMYFQGISVNPRKTTIGIAYSNDGIAWDEPIPILSIENTDVIKALDVEKYETQDLIEPCVIKDGNKFRMWFISRGKNEESNRLHHAVSSNGLEWEIDNVDLLSNFNFEGSKVYYPQVIREYDGEYSCFITLVKPNGKYSISKLSSSNGLIFQDVEDVLPNALDVRSWDFAKKIRIPKLRGLIAICMDIVLKKIAPRNFYGYAHAHWLIDDAEGKCMFYHTYHYDVENNTYMDIGRINFDGTSKATPVTVLSPSKNVNDWDSYFVADPYVIQVN